MQLRRVTVWHEQQLYIFEDFEDKKLSVKILKNNEI